MLRRTFVRSALNLSQMSPVKIKISQMHFSQFRKPHLPTTKLQERIIVAGRDNDLKTLEELKQFIRFANPNVAGNTPLHLAAINAHERAVEYLLKHNAPMYYRNSYGQQPFELIFVNLFYYQKWSTYQKIQKFNRILDLFLGHGLELNDRHNPSEPYLHLLANLGALEACKILHKKGADLNLCDHHGNTPLHIVATKGQYHKEQLEVARFLLANGAAHWAENAKGKTPLDIAQSFNGHEEVGKLLSPYKTPKLRF